MTPRWATPPTAPHPPRGTSSCRTRASGQIAAIRDQAALQAYLQAADGGSGEARTDSGQPAGLCGHPQRCGPRLPPPCAAAGGAALPFGMAAPPGGGGGGLPPGLQQMMAQNPQMLEGLLQNPEMLAQLMQVPEVQAAMQNPEVMQQLGLNPEMMQAMMGMMAAGGGGGGGGAVNPVLAQPRPTTRRRSPGSWRSASRVRWSSRPTRLREKRESRCQLSL